MKEFYKSAIWAGLLLIVLIFTSCQKEYEPIVETSEKDTITADSNAANLLISIASNDGSFDNIVDGSSCFDIQFPYEVVVNGSKIPIISSGDFELVEQIFDSIDDDNDVLEIIFPVTITLADYSEITIENIGQLQEYTQACVEGGNDADIECIDIIYPITFFTFAIDNQQTNVVIVENDKELRRFFLGLELNDIFSIKYPVTFELINGEKITVNTNDQLSEAIEQAKETCDEDDDDDYNDDDFTEDQLNLILIECPWLIQEVKRDSQNNTEQYINYLMSFNENGSVTVRDREGTIIDGEWATKVTNHQVMLTLEFESLVDFNHEWFVYELDAEHIKFYADDDNKIILKNNCDGVVPIVCDDTFIENTLSKCKWVVVSGSENFLYNLNFDFSNMNITAVNEQGEVVDEGSWNVENEHLIFNNFSMNLANYSGHWSVVECAAERLKITHSDSFMIIEKKCE